MTRAGGTRPPRTLLTPDHPEWAAVTAKLEKLAERNLNVMVEHMQLGADAFRDDANDMITEYIKEPPKDFSAPPPAAQSRASRSRREEDSSWKCPAGIAAPATAQDSRG